LIGLLIGSIVFGAANVRDTGKVLVHNCTMPHVDFRVDLGSDATMNNIRASGVLFHYCCTSDQDRFRVDFSALLLTIAFVGGKITLLDPRE
jgi:hypothetical protein